MINENKIFFSDENGEKKEYDIIFTFDTDDKTYYIYTDDELDEEGFIKTYAGIYDCDGKNERLLPVKTDEEWELIEAMIERFEKEV